MSTNKRVSFGSVNSERLDVFFAQNEVTAEELHATFLAKENLFMQSRGGPFVWPSKRAFCYRSIIGHLLRNGLDEGMPNGRLISQEQLEHAREHFNNATIRGVWAAENGSLRDRDDCERHRAAAAEMIQQAEERLSAEKDVLEIDSQEFDCGKMQENAR